MTFRSVVAGGETYSVPLSAEQAGHSRDALARSLYEKQFDALVTRCARPPAPSAFAVGLRRSACAVGMIRRPRPNRATAAPGPSPPALQWGSAAACAASTRL